MLNAVIQRCRAVIADERGISALEYGVLAVAILAAVATGAGLVGTQLGTVFSGIVTHLGG